MSYDIFAKYYDSLMKNADYDKRAEYYCSVLSEYGIDKGILLDLGCGTGSMSVRMADAGYEVIGTDASVGMLMQARQNAAGRDILFLNQRMEELDLYGTINCSISVMDCINHLDGPESIEKAFGKVSLFTEPGGLFVFDMNTLYKHREILKNNCFVYENSDVFCVWQNTPLSDRAIEICLDFFEKEGDSYFRSSETFTEYAYETEEITAMLEKAGFEVLAVYNDMTHDKLKPDDERALFIARKQR